jgi:molecular chaperone GrpE
LTRPLESSPTAPNYNLFDYFDKTINMDAKPEDVSPNPAAEGTPAPDAAAHAEATPTAEANNTDPAALQAQVAELSEQYLRAKADMENLRRRTEDEVAKVRKFAVESFAESLLPVIDSLEAGLAIQEATVQQIREGSEATLKQLQSALARNKVAEIAPAAGTKFDPHHHQAISMVPADQEANTVVSVLQKGYQIADRVLRPALVTVAAPK